MSQKDILAGIQAIFLRLSRENALALGKVTGNQIRNAAAYLENEDIEKLIKTLSTIAYTILGSEKLSHIHPEAAELLELRIKLAFSDVTKNTENVFAGIVKCLKTITKQRKEKSFDNLVKKFISHDAELIYLMKRANNKASEDRIVNKFLSMESLLKAIVAKISSKEIRDDIGRNWGFYSQKLNHALNELGYQNVKPQPPAVWASSRYP
jgi:hypothetical protein